MNRKTKDHLKFLDTFLVEGRERFLEVFKNTKSDRAVLEAYMEALKHRLPKAENLGYSELDKLSELPEETLDKILELLESVSDN